MPVSINTINDHKNEQIYVDNPSSAPVYDTQFDGLTQVLTCFAHGHAGGEQHAASGRGRHQ